MQALFSSSGIRMKSIEYQLTSLKYLLIEIDTHGHEAESTIRAVSPDFHRLKMAASHDISGIIVTCCNGMPSVLHFEHGMPCNC